MALLVLVAHLTVRKGKQDIQDFVKGYTYLMIATEVGLIIPIYIDRAKPEILTDILRDYVYLIIVGLNAVIVLLVPFFYRFRKQFIEEIQKENEDMMQGEMDGNASLSTIRTQTQASEAIKLDGDDGDSKRKETTKTAGTIPVGLNPESDESMRKETELKKKDLASIGMLKNPSKLKHKEDNWFLLVENNFSDIYHKDIFRLLTELDILTMLCLLCLGYLGGAYYLIWNSAQIFREASLDKAGIFYYSPLLLIVLCSLLIRAIKWTKNRAALLVLLCFTILLIGLFI